MIIESIRTLLLRKRVLRESSSSDIRQIYSRIQCLSWYRKSTKVITIITSHRFSFTLLLVVSFSFQASNKFIQKIVFIFKFVKLIRHFLELGGFFLCSIMLSYNFLKFINLKDLKFQFIILFFQFFVQPFYRFLKALFLFGLCKDLIPLFLCNCHLIINQALHFLTIHGQFFNLKLLLVNLLLLNFKFSIYCIYSIV